VKAWQRILADSLTTSNQLLSRLGLTDQVQSVDQSPDFPVRVPEPFVTRMVPGDPHDPLLRQVLAVADERHAMPGFVKDPLDELEGPMPGVLHKYRSRVLVIYRGGCAINCRYCFRRHFPYQENTLTARDIDGLVSYLKAHPEVNEVILSGGDPLMSDDQALSDLFVRLESVSSIQWWLRH